MKKIATLTLLIFVAIACQRNADQLDDPAFITVDQKQFTLAGEPFFPMMLNYVVEYYSDSGQFIVGPHIDYEEIGVAEHADAEGIQQQLNNHFSLIKLMGFNTLRICLNRTESDEHGSYYQTHQRRFYLQDEQDRAAILKGVETLLATAKEQGLYVMLLIKPFFQDDEIKVFTEELLKHNADNPTLFAYDFFNEPLYFDPEKDRYKRSAKKVVKQWQKMMNKCAPHQLFTIGFSEPMEVFEWDPFIMPVDFTEIHTYHPLRACSEIYWYALHANKPWMVGETSLPADNDSISYLDQSLFLQEIYSYARDAGAAGFGWWEFQDIPSASFEAAFTGLLNHEGVTALPNGGKFAGSRKPASYLIDSLQKNYTPQPLHRPTNYFNMLGYNNLAIKGRVIDQFSSKPIRGAVVRGWNDNWTVGINTFSDEEGYFTLYCNQPCTHFVISAPQMTTKTINTHIDYTTVNQNVNIDSLPDKDLEYHTIAYHTFLDTNHLGKSVTHWDSSLFDTYHYVGELGDVKIRKIWFIGR